MTYNSMRSTQNNRWVIKKYQGEELDFGEHDLRDLVPLNHWVILKSQKDEVQVRCKDCGYFLQLSIKKLKSYDNHTISEDGIVTPSIGHGCGFHEWGILEDWKKTIPKIFLTFYPIQHATDETLKLACEKAIGQPVWDHPSQKNKQIGKVIKAAPSIKENIKGMDLQMEIFNEATILKINQSSLKGLSIGGNKE